MVGIQAQMVHQIRMQGKQKRRNPPPPPRASIMWQPQTSHRSLAFAATSTKGFCNRVLTCKWETTFQNKVTGDSSSKTNAKESGGYFYSRQFCATQTRAVGNTPQEYHGQSRVRMIAFPKEEFYLWGSLYMHGQDINTLVISRPRLKAPTAQEYCDPQGSLATSLSAIGCNPTLACAATTTDATTDANINKPVYPPGM